MALSTFKSASEELRVKTPVAPDAEPTVKAIVMQMAILLANQARELKKLNREALRVTIEAEVTTMLERASKEQSAAIISAFKGAVGGITKISAGAVGASSSGKKADLDAAAAKRQVFLGVGELVQTPIEIFASIEQNKARRLDAMQKRLQADADLIRDSKDSASQSWASLLEVMREVVRGTGAAHQAIVSR